jgi:FAS-associated factor 2
MRNSGFEEEYSLSHLREAQDQAYAESLLEDQQRMQEREEEEEMEAMKEALELSIAEEKERQQKALEKAVKPEPAEGEEGVCVLAVRCPDGSRLQRRLLREDTIGNLRDWLRTQTDVVPARFTVAMDYPRREFRDMSQTLEAAGMYPRAAINVLAVEDEEEEEDDMGGLSLGLGGSNSNNNALF